MRCRPPAEHSFLIRSIKTLHVYSQIMIVVNKLMQPSSSHGFNVNKEGGGGQWHRRRVADIYRTKKQFKNDRNFLW